MKTCYRNIIVEIFGESHSEEIGLVFEGLPQGIEIDKDKLGNFLERRKAGKGPHSTERKENDEPIFIEGIKDNFTTGAPLKAVIKNQDIKAAPYGEIAFIPRPSHADYVGHVKSGYQGFSTGGGRFSGRMTAPLCVAGFIAKEYLARKGIEVLAYIGKIGKIKSISYKDSELQWEQIKRIQALPLPVIDEEARKKMEDEIERAKLEKDSLGGVIECIVFGLGPGLGDSMQLGLEGRISCSVFGVPAVKGIEFGQGFAIAEMKGSQANDPFIKKNGKIVTTTNNSGGINGGISNGMPITLSVAIRPTPSIGKKQQSVNLETGEEVTISIKGRHDSCIVPRAVPCVEAAVALALMDALLDCES